jgi:hypothetical protein
MEKEAIVGVEEGREGSEVRQDCINKKIRK